jgi:filamentous hemagglutinin family protein
MTIALQRRPARALALLGASTLALGLNAAQAQSPQGGLVVKGPASVAQTAGRSVIRQTSQRAVIDWQGFDVGPDHRVIFQQPGRSAATLNRVNAASPSVIEGAIRAPGTVIIQNTAGVIFTGKARVDAGGLVATSQIVDPDAFQGSGRLRIGGGERLGARVVNRGGITIGETGLAALVGGDVENAGSIVARRGTVALASGARTTIDLAGDGMVRIAVAGDAAGGGGVANGGLIDVGGGRVLMTAGAARDAVEGAINTSGIIRATASSGAGGRVELIGRGAGKVRVRGEIDASGAEGGSVTVTGETVELGERARVAARGGGDGGSVRLGGDRQGRGPLRRAERLDIAAGAEVAADGGDGRGGSVVAWSDGATFVDGRISATGGDGGGFVETSGAFRLGIGRHAEVSPGRGGDWLLDPRDVVIGNGGLSPVPPGTTNPPPGSGAYQINRLAVVGALNAGSDVTITTAQPGSRMPGDITVSGALSWTGSGDLRLVAERDIRIDAAVSSRDGDFTAEAARHVSVSRSVTADGTGDIALGAGTGNLTITEATSGDVIVSTNQGGLGLRSTKGWVLLERSGGSAAGSVQVFSASGRIDMAADEGVRLRGGSKAGQWVRVGRTGDASDISMTARWVKVWGGSAGNAFAEVVAGAGGSLDIEAGEIQVRSGGSEGRIAALNGASLTMQAAEQSWEGPVRAGTGGSDGGDVLLSGAITATVQPQFSLASGRGFTLAPATPDGAASSYSSTRPFAVSTSGTGAIDIGGPLRAPQVTLVSREQVRLRAGANVTGTGAGDAVVIAAGGSFRNENGADALRAPDAGARWLLYVDRFDGMEGDEPDSGQFDLYGRPFASNPPSSIGIGGDRVIYGETPVITVTAETSSKTYGTAAAPGYTLTGLRAGDDLGTAIDYLEVTSLGAPAGARVGRYATRATAVPSIQGYTIRSVDGTLTVDPAVLTVTARDAVRTYGAANPAFSASIDGFVLGDDPGILEGELAFSTPATSASTAGRYAVTPSGLTTPDGNYRLAFVDGTLTVDPAPLTVTVNDAARVYGAANPDFSARFDGFVRGEGAGDLGGALGFATAADRRSGVGDYRVRGSGLRSGNYAITYVDGTLIIDPAPLTVTVNDAARTYGAANPRFTASFDGFVLGEGLGDLGGSLEFATAATRGSDAGSYRVTAGGLAGGNYAISYVGGALTVDPAPLTVTVNDAARTYGGRNPEFSARFDGFVLGEGVGDLGGALRFDTAATERSPVGRYAVTARGLESGNYAISYADGTLAVGAAPLTVTVNDAARTYGARNPGFTAHFDGFVLGEGPGDLGGKLAFATEATRRSRVGAYGVTASGLDGGNYAVSYVDGTLTIDPAPLTVTVNDAARTYGARNPGFAAGFEGFVLGEDAGDVGGALVFDTAATRRSGVGRYAVGASGLDSGNYTVSYVDGTLTIDPAALTVTVNDAARTYGAANPDFSARFDGLVLGETPGDLGGGLAFATAATRRSGAGDYAVTAGGLRSGNYAISYVGGTLAVDPAPLVVTANDAARAAGEPNPAFSARFDGFVLGEGVGDLAGELGFTTAAGPGSGPGAYAITPGGLDSGNYAISYVDGTLLVTPRSGQPVPAGPSFSDMVEPFARGVPPLTPGDASFRTTVAEAPPALANPFDLTYSLGEIVQLAPPGQAGTDGFVPASGGSDGSAAPDCSGPINRGGGDEACVRQALVESYWTTTSERLP